MKTELKTIIQKSLKKFKIDFDLFEIEILNSKNQNFGDYSTNVAFKVAKILKQSPIEFAEKLSTSIKSEHIEKIEVVKPGFINFFINIKSLVNITLSDFKKNSNLNFDDGEALKINYEFVSANPTGFLHIGHARNAIIGDISINALKHLNHKVLREYYINDAGNQIFTLGASVLYHYVKQNKIKYDLAKDEVGYNGFEIIEYAKKLKLDNKLFETKDKTELITYVGKLAKKYFMEEVRATLSNLKISPFESFISEQSLFDDKNVESTIKKLKQTKHLYEKDGALFIKSSKHNDDKDRVLIKSDGSYTYMVADVANHVLKYDRGFNKLINLWGSDHHGYEKRIKASCKFLGYNDEEIEVYYISMVKLLENGKELKMSKRAGTSLTINEVLKIIEPDILKYAMISKSREQLIAIDLAEITKKDMSNPYWYIQYGNARMNQLLEKYGKTKISKIDSFSLLGVDEKKIILKLNDFEDILKHTARKSEPYILWNYTYELVSLFHSYYNFSIIISDNKQLSLEKINFIMILKNVLSEIFNILNMKLINKM